MHVPGFKNQREVVMDPMFEFEKRCREAGKDLFEEALGIIQRGEGSKIDEKLHALTYEFTDGTVPISTFELHKLTDCLEEFWDDIDRSGMLDQAFRQAVFYKASNWVVEEFERHMSSRQIEDLVDAYAAAEGAMRSENPQVQWSELSVEYAEEFKMLGWTTDWPPTQPELLKVLGDAQIKPEPQLEAVSTLSLSLIRLPRGPR
jgi:hypothetical protein